MERHRGGTETVAPGPSGPARGRVRASAEAGPPVRPGVARSEAPERAAPPRPDRVDPSAPLPRDVAPVFEVLARLAALAVAALGAAVLTGWALGVDRLRQPIPGQVSMKPNTAACFVLSGFALEVLRRPDARSGWVRAARLAALATLIVGLLTLAEYVFGWSLRIEEILFRDTLDAAKTEFPGRMARATAASFTGAGIALLLLGRTRRGAVSPSELLGAAVAVVGLLSTLGYVYGVDALTGIADSTYIAVHTAIGLVILGSGLLVARPEGGIAAVLARRDAGGLLARRLLPAAIVVPLVLGLLRVIGENLGWYGPRFGVALLSASTMVVYVVLTYLAVASISRTDAARATAQHEADATHRMLQAILDHAGTPIYVKGRDGRWLLANREAERGLGLPRGGAIGRTDRELLPPEVAEAVGANDRTVLATGRPLAAEEQVPDRGELRTYVSVKFPLLDADGVTYAVGGVSTDITELKRAQESLEALTRELEQRVADRTAELAMANRELEAFSHSVAHDLRAPLRAVDGFARALEEDCADRLDDVGRAYVTRLRAGSQRMGVLLDHLLDLARISRRTVVRSAVDVSAIAAEIARRLRTHEPERCVDFRIAPGIRAHADEPLMEIVLQNLLENACKFTAHHDSATIEVGAVEEDGERVYFVRDDGAGFDQEHAGRLFGAFQRLHSLHEFEGTGIGLATVERVIRLHRGRVWAQGRVEQGATFSFTLGSEDR